MTARELWNSMAAGHTRALLSDRQRTFLIDLAKKEQLFDADHTAVHFKDGLIVRIRNAKTTVGAYGGGLVSKVITGKFIAEQTYVIKFIDTGLTQIATQDEMVSIKARGLVFKILKP